MALDCPFSERLRDTEVNQNFTSQGNFAMINTGVDSKLSNVAWK